MLPEIPGLSNQKNESYESHSSASNADYTSVLKPSKERNHYYCPVCNGSKLWVAPHPLPPHNVPANSCKNGCDSKAVREEIKRLHGVPEKKTYVQPVDRTVRKSLKPEGSFRFPSHLKGLDSRAKEYLTTERGFSADTVETLESEGLIVSVTDEQARSLRVFGHSDHSDMSGILLKWGESFGELRCWNPPIDAEGKPIKYLQMVQNSGRKRVAWMPEGAIAATEGLFDALHGTYSLGVPTAAIPGIGQYRILPENCGLVLVADSDALTNKHVLDSLEKGSKYLGSGFAIVPDVAPKAGLQELVKIGKTHQDYKAMINSAKSTQKETYEEQEAYAEPGKVEPWILSARMGLGLPLAVVKVDKKTGEETYGTPTELVAAEYILERYKGQIYRSGDDLCWFNPATGIFEPLGVDKNSSPSKMTLIKKLSEILATADPMSAVPIAKATWIKQLQDMLIATAPQIQFCDNSRYIPLLNGVYDAQTKTLKTYEELRIGGVLFNYQAPVEYKPGAKCPRFMQWLDESLSEQDQKKIRAGMFATVFSLARLKILMEMVGESDSGKSVIQRVLTALVGLSKVKSFDLKKIQENNFSLSNSVGRKLIVVPDTKGFVGNPDVLKRLSGLDAIDVERKNGHAFDTTFTGIIWIAGNAPIVTADDDDAFTKRRIVCRFPNSVPVERQRKLLEFESGKPAGDFADELPGILNWVLDLGIEGTERIIRSVKTDKTQYVATLLESNTIAQWLNQNCVIRPGADVITEVGVKSGDPDKCLYASYLRYCEDNGHKHPMAIQKFKAQVVEISNKCQTLVKLKSANPHSHGKRSVIVGIELIRRDNQGQLDSDQASLSYSVLSGAPADGNDERLNQVELATALVKKLRESDDEQTRAASLLEFYEYNRVTTEGDRLIAYMMPERLKQWFLSELSGNAELSIIRSANISA